MRQTTNAGIWWLIYDEWSLVLTHVLSLPHGFSLWRLTDISCLTHAAYWTAPRRASDELVRNNRLIDESRFMNAMHHVTLVSSPPCRCPQALAECSGWSQKLVHVISRQYLCIVASSFHRSLMIRLAGSGHSHLTSVMASLLDTYCYCYYVA